MINPEVKKHIDYIDLAKGLCILSVLWYHTNYSLLDNQFELALRSYRMPFYYFLSGLFFKMYGGFGDFVVKKINKLIVPFTFFYLISYCFGAICGYLGFYEKGIMGDPFHWTLIFDVLVNEKLVFNGPIWFFICLFNVNIIFYSLRLLSGGNDKLLGILVVITGTAGFFINNSNFDLPVQIDLPYYWDIALRETPFFAMGYFLRTYTPFLSISRYDRYSLLLLPVGAVVIYMLAPADLYENFFMFYGLGAVGIVMMMVISKNIKSLPVITYIGKYSLIILGTHVFLILPIRFIASNLIAGPGYVLLPWVLVIICSIPVIWFMKRYFPWFTAQKDLIHARESKNKNIKAAV